MSVDKTIGTSDLEKTTDDSEIKNTDNPVNDAEDKTQKAEAKKEFTQEQLNRMMTKEKRQGRNAALSELGIDPKNESEIERLKALIESAKTQEEKAVDEKVNNQKSIAEAEQRAAIAEAKVEAMRLGVQPQYVDDTITLITAKAQDGDDIKTLVGEIKIKYPEWFTDTEKQTKKETDKKGTGTSVSAGASGGGSEKSLGERLAAQRKQGQNKTSYWSQ